MFSLSDNYVISFCGVHGSGKTTLECLFADEFNLSIPTKRNLFPLRMINYEGLTEYLVNYYDQIKSYDNFDRCIVTSRFGILDILIYAEALLNVNRINRKERLQIISKCEDLIPLWPLPQYLIHLTAELNILHKRLTERDLEYKNGIKRDKVKINAIREEYLNNIEKEQFSNLAIEDIVINYKSVDRIITLDSSKILPNELFAIIREWSYLDLDFYEK
jgi:cytidylate kinase